VHSRMLAPVLWLGLLHVAVLGAHFFSPYDHTQQNRSVPFAPPTRIRFMDLQGALHFRPFVCRQVPEAGSFTTYTEDCTNVFPIRFFVSGHPYTIAGLVESRLHLFGVDQDAVLFLMGTDNYGRDQFSRLLHGGRISLLAGVFASVLSISLGLLLGATAGFYGKWIDEGIMWLAELFLALPWLYLLFAVRAFLPLDVGPATAFVLIVCIIGVVGWARPARLIRGVVLSAKERDYVLAARSFGASDAHILRKHVLPQTIGIVVTQASVLIPRYILAEVTLSFLGLGVNEPASSWGRMLSTLQQYHVLVSYWWMYIPGLLLVPTFSSYIALSNAVQTKFGLPERVNK
jgi:peptide/nickel transport system permease protein